MDRTLAVIIGRVLWITGLSALFFQCYFPVLSSLIVPAILGFIFINLFEVKKEPTTGWLKVFSIYVLFIALSASISLFCNNNLGNILRFSIILIVIPLAYLEVISDFETEWTILKILIGLKALSIIAIWIIVFIQQDYLFWRKWAYALGAGDIYILSGIPRVQLQGNSLLLFMGLADYENSQGFTKYNLVLLFSVLCAGNSAFFLGVFIFFSVKVIQRIFKDARDNNKNGFFLIALLTFFVIVFGIYGMRQLELKSSGIEDTNKVRIEQAELLLDTNPIWGDGVGSYANGKISTRVYVNETYFELQTLYIFHQIGLIGMGLFLLITFMPVFGNKKALLLYCVYLIYAFWNPYSFDTTHIIVVTVLSNVFLKDTFTGKNDERICRI